MNAPEQGATRETDALIEECAAEWLTYGLDASYGQEDWFAYFEEIHSRLPDHARKQEREIARLRADREALVDALKPFADLARILDSKMAHLPKEGSLHSWDTRETGPLALTVEMLLAARAALTQHGGER